MSLVDSKGQAPFFHSVKNPSLLPDVKYYKSKEAEAEYKKAKLPYPETGRCR